MTCVKFCCLAVCQCHVATKHNCHSSQPVTERTSQPLALAALLEQLVGMQCLQPASVYRPLAAADASDAIAIAVLYAIEPLP